MSIQSLETFYQEVRSNPELEQLATSALEDGPGALVVLARLKGFAFTEEELVAALSRQSELGEGELSDRDLDLVAGGTYSMAKAPDSGGMVRR